MKLQAPRQIQSELALQRKTQVDEGVKIAQKVDVLRETLASLEAQHTKFLAGTREESNRIITELDNKISSLKGEIRSLEEKRTELLKPLNGEWDKLEEEKNNHKLLVADFETKKDELQIKAKEITEAEKRLKEKKEVFDAREETINRVSRETYELNEKARMLKDMQDREYGLFQANLTEQTRQMEEREKAFASQTKLIEHSKSILERKEKELNDRERFINDKYQQLLTTTEQINNGKRKKR